MTFKIKDCSCNMEMECYATAVSVGCNRLILLSAVYRARIDLLQFLTRCFHKIDDLGFQTIII